MNYLNLGCGSRFHADWVNLDFKSTHASVVECDLRNGIPYSDNSFQVVYHSHVLEHFTREDALGFLEECHRVTAPNGVIRVAVPDLEGIVRCYLEALDMALEGKEEGKLNHEWMMLELYDQAMRRHSGGLMMEYLRRSPIPNESFVRGRMGGEASRIIEPVRSLAPAGTGRGSVFQRVRRRFRAVPGKLRSALVKSLLGEEDYGILSVARFRAGGEIHQWMYDRYSLKGALEKAGFKEPKRVGPMESRIPDWPSFNLDTDSDGSVYKPDSLYMEAVKS